MEKISIKRIQTKLENSNIRKMDITKIIKGLKLLESKGVAANDLEIIVKNVIKDPEYRADFIRDPLGVAGGFAPPYVPVSPK